MIRPYDTWALARLVAGGDVNGEMEHVSSPHRRLCDHLATLPLEARQPALTAFLKSRPEAEEQAVILALADIDPEGQAPEDPDPGRLFATLADVAKVVSAQPWLWKEWLAMGVLNVVAADPGIGKSRFALDIARRLWLGLPWPDNQPNEFPAETRTLWVLGDRNFAETLQAASDFGLPPEAVALGSSPEEPFGSLDLDDPATLAALGERIQAAAVPLAVIDTVGMTTNRNLCRPEEAREFFAPILELCQKTGVALLGLTHLSANKEALGRRIVEKARVVIKMVQPDPEGQRDRRRLWVDKTAVVKPPALGITMGNEGNTYDFDPPKEPEPTQRRPGPPPIKLEECKRWLVEHLTPNPTRVKDVRDEAEKAGYSVDTLYRSRDALGVEEYTFERLKWWKLPSVGDPDPYKDSDNSDNSDKWKMPVTEDGGSDFDPGDFEEMDCL